MKGVWGPAGQHAFPDLVHEYMYVGDRSFVGAVRLSIKVRSSRTF